MSSYTQTRATSVKKTRAKKVSQIQWACCYIMSVAPVNLFIWVSPALFPMPITALCRELFIPSQSKFFFTISPIPSEFEEGNEQAVQHSSQGMVFSLTPASKDTSQKPCSALQQRRRALAATLEPHTASEVSYEFPQSASLIVVRTQGVLWHLWSPSLYVNVHFWHENRPFLHSFKSSCLIITSTSPVSSAFKISFTVGLYLNALLLTGCVIYPIRHQISISWPESSRFPSKQDCVSWCLANVFRSFNM